MAAQLLLIDVVTHIWIKLNIGSYVSYTEQWYIYVISQLYSNIMRATHFTQLKGK